MRTLYLILFVLCGCGVETANRHADVDASVDSDAALDAFAAVDASAVVDATVDAQLDVVDAESADAGVDASCDNDRMKKLHKHDHRHWHPGRH